MIGFGENLFGQNGTDPCSWESFRLGRESVIGAGFSSDAAARLIGGEHWSCGGEIAESALLAREAHLVCMTDGSLVVRGCATEKENNGVGRFDSGVVVDTLCYVYDSVADKHNWSANVSGWCVKDGEIVCPKLLDERVTRCRNVEQWVRCDGQRRDPGGQQSLVCMAWPRRTGIEATAHQREAGGAKSIQHPLR